MFTNAEALIADFFEGDDAEFEHEIEKVKNHKAEPGLKEFSEAWEA